LYLRVDANQDDHEKEEHGPEGGEVERHDAGGVGDEEQARAALGHLRHQLALLARHVADEREDDEAGEDARAAVDQADRKGLPL